MKIRKTKILISAVPTYLVIVTLIILSIAHQLHTGLNMSAQLVRFAPADWLPQLSPLFWIGFVVMTIAASGLNRRVGAGGMLVIGSVLGTLALTLTFFAPNLPSMIATQMLMGFAWGGALMGPFFMAMAAGKERRSQAIGIVFSILALGAVVRLMIVGAKWPASPEIKAALPALTLGIWAVGMLCAIGMLTHADTKRAG